MSQLAWPRNACPVVNVSIVVAFIRPGGSIGRARTKSVECAAPNVFQCSVSTRFARSLRLTGAPRFTINSKPRV